MGDIDTLNRLFQIILKQMIETGQAPHYTEIAAKMKVPIEEGRQAMHALYTPPFPAWLLPNTDYISCFPPFSNLPTQYRISVNGEQKWFGQ